ncbi:nitronate monooxygenase [Nitrogeniibacter mangrovi]|uniref:Nitronate monooxygenase n=1 Tax=Nitrogeniibacter mangrovi TaxID=2016596 RepID=A0A6C1B3B3_9RHOO|nr:nitronate monooxygenase [Nitrogeniibacter mangrovi]QID17345.1 nitronate monooxygenase [Nitrogeniibacter mangrovi]
MSSFETLVAKLGIRYPIIQAPMAGVSTPGLVAEVSEAGGLGSLGLGAATVDQAARQIRETRQLTDKPFNVNLFCHRPATADHARETAWLTHLAAEFRKFGAEPPKSLREIYPTALGNDALLAMLLDEKPAVVSFHFGLPDPHWIAALRQAGIVTMACATDLAEADAVEHAGIDVLVAQGAEAGGHRGIFDPAEDKLIGTFSLVRLLSRQTRLPIVAAGGIMDGDGVAAALRLGASAAQMGTAFILCPESSASLAYRNALKSASAHHTAITSAISGRPARGIVNRLHTLGRDDAPAPPDYPITYHAGKALHQAAAKRGDDSYAAHWAGQGAPLVRELPAAALIEQIVEEWQHAEVTLGGVSGDRADESVVGD